MQTDIFFCIKHMCLFVPLLIKLSPILTTVREKSPLHCILQLHITLKISKILTTKCCSTFPAFEMIGKANFCITP